MDTPREPFLGTESGSKPKVCIRAATEEDGLQINDLYNKVFGSQRPLAVWRWRYVENPCRIDDDVLEITVGEYEGVLAAHYGVSTRTLSIQGRNIRAIYTQDLFVDPEMGKKIHLRGLFKASCERGLARGHEFGFGFPKVDTAYKAGKKLLGYKDVAFLEQLFRRLNWYLAFHRRVPWIAPLLERIIRGSASAFYARPFQRRLALSSKDWPIEQVTEFPDEMDGLWERMRTRFPIIGLRDHKFLNWRYQQRPGTNYHIFLVRRPTGALAGYLVLAIRQSLESKDGYLVDYLAEEDCALDALVDSAGLFCARAQLDGMLCLGSPGGPYQERLKQQHRFAKRDFLHAIPLVYFPFRTIDYDAVLKEQTNWFVTYGDTADM